MPTNVFNTGNSSTPSYKPSQLAPSTPSSAFGGTPSGSFGAPSFNVPYTPAPAAPQLPLISTGPFGGITPALQASANAAQVKPTATGGVSFNPSIASAYKHAAPATPVVSQPQGLASLTPGSYSTSNGGTVATSGGVPTGYTSGGNFSIETTGPVPSDALTSYANPQQTYKNQQDFVNAVSQANGYNSSYIGALQGQYDAQTQGAQLQANAANINANQAVGIGTTGLNTSQAGTLTGQEQALNSQQEQTNAIQQLSANQALNIQQLARTGNIAAAQAQLQYSPTSIANQDAQAQYNALQQQYPNAGIPPFDPSGNALQQQQLAQSLVASSPAYQAGFTSTYTNAQGGTDILNKLAMGNLQQNPDGTYQLVNGADKAIGDANAAIVTKQADIYSNIGSALTSFQKTAASTIGFMNSYGLNQSGQPILTQLQNATDAQLPNKAAAIAAYKVDVSNLQNDYATFLTARDGSVAGTNDKAAQTIDISTLSPSQLQTVISEMTKDGQNTQSGALQQIQTATQGLRTNTAASSISSAGTGAVGSSWDNL